MKKLDPKTDGSTPDIVQQNLGSLNELFPSVFTEGKVDFEALRETLGDYIDDRPERYSFTWNGKSRARRIAQTPSTGTLRPCPEESVNWDTTQNLFIEGDNLEVLKLLQKSYHKKVKMIYIDPPFNTGNEFIYPDKYDDNLDTYLRYTHQVDAEGFKLSANSETAGRYHTNWLNMMLPRLKLARNLLRDDGILFISIDDHEVHNLRNVCNELFGEENLLACITWKRRQVPDNRNTNNVSTDHEYVLAYGRGETVFKGTAKDLSKYSNPDGDPRGPWMSDNMTGLATKEQRPNLHYDIKNPETGNTYPPHPGRGWAYEPKRMEILIAEGRVLWPRKVDGRPRIKRFLADIQDKTTGFSTVQSPGYTTDGTREVTELMGFKAFDFPKPTSLVTMLLGQSTSPNENEIVLDFFAGSATTADAVMTANFDDGGNRSCILVQLPEPLEDNSEAKRLGHETIADIGKERIRRVIKKLGFKQAEKTREAEEKLPGTTDCVPKLDLGFKAFKLSSTNIHPWDADFDNLEETLFTSVENIKPDRSEADVLYELLLKYGLDLAVAIEERQISGKTVFIIGAGALIVCLADDVSLETVEGIAALKEELRPEVMRVVFKDSGFKDDVVKTNTVQILRQAGIEDVKSL